MRSTAFELRNRTGWPLRGDLFVPDGPPPHPAVVVCHGFKGFKNWGFFPYVARRLAEAGFLAVPFNTSGCGVGADLETFTELGRFAADTVTAQLGDLGTVVDALATGTLGGGAADPARLALLGHSRGGGAAVLHARDDRRVRAVATWAGISTFERWTEAEARVWRERGALEVLNARTGQRLRMDVTFLDDLAAHAGRYDVLRAVPELEVPLLVVHGEEDTSVPAREAHALHAAGRPGTVQLVLVPGTGHTFGAEHPWKGSTPALETALDRTLEWLQIQLGAVHEGSRER